MAGESVVQTLNEVTGQATTLEIMQVLYDQMGSDFRSRVPEPTLDNVKEFGQAVTDDPNTLNDFATGMVMKFAKTVFNQTLINNTLKKFKKGLMPVGWKIEEIFVHAAKGTKYDPEQSYAEVEKRKLPDVEVIYHVENSRLKYKATMSKAQVKSAFTSWDGVNNLLTQVIQSLYDGAEIDEFAIMKQLMISYIEKGLAKVVVVPEIKGNENEFVIQAKTYSNLLEFMSNDYNSAGVIRQTPKSEQHLVLRAREDARIDVESLASAFNMDKMNFYGHKDIIDNFGDLEVVGALFSENWFQVYDTEIEFNSRYNEDGLYWNYWFHKWSVFSTSRFEPFIVFVTSSDQVVTGVTVDPVTTIVKKGATKQFNYLLNVVDDTTSTTEPTFDKGVTWTVTGGVAGTTISTDGLLTVAPEETATHLTVKATSIENTSAFGQSLVQVNSFFD